MAERSWRQMAVAFIDEKIKEYPNIEGKELRDAVNKCYPWGQRTNHPYKIWCDVLAKRFGKTRPTPPNAKTEILKRQYAEHMEQIGQQRIEL